MTMIARDLFSGEIHKKQDQYFYFQNQWGTEFIKAEYWKGFNGSKSDYKEQTCCTIDSNGKVEIKVYLNPFVCFDSKKRISKAIFEAKYQEVQNKVILFEAIKGDNYLIVVEQYCRHYFAMLKGKVIQQFTICDDRIELNNPYNITDESKSISFLDYQYAVKQLIALGKDIHEKSNFKLIHRNYFNVYVKESLNINQYFMRTLIDKDDATSWKYHRPGMLTNYGESGMKGFNVYSFDENYKEKVEKQLSRTIYKGRDNQSYLLKENIHYVIKQRTKN